MPGFVDRCPPPAGVRAASLLDNFNQQVSTRTDTRVNWAAAKNVELTCVPLCVSGSIAPRLRSPQWALTLAARATPATTKQSVMIRRYIAWRSHHAHDHRP
jgi:hypothetical protein